VALEEIEKVSTSLGGLIQETSHNRKAVRQGGASAGHISNTHETGDQRSHLAGPLLVPPTAPQHIGESADSRRRSLPPVR